MISEERINTQNTINARANEVEGHLVRLFSEWQDVKALKVSGSGGFVKKLQTQLEEYEESHGYNSDDWWLHCYASYGSIIANLRNRKSALKVEIYLARFDTQTGILSQVHDCIQRKTDYTVKDVANNIKKARELEEQARQLRSEIRDFSIR